MSGLTTRFITTAQLPLVIEPADRNIQQKDFLTLLEQQKNFLQDTLLKYGALLLRNFPIHNEEDFSTVIKHLNHEKFLNYIGGDSPRKKIREGIYTSTEAPPSMKIPLHNELSFVKNYPAHIYFYCSIAPSEKGETPIADARKVYQSIDDEIKNAFVEKGLRYVSRYYYKSKLMSLIKGHKSWIDVFETENKDLVEKMCHEHEFSYQWHPRDWLEISQVRPATLRHPQTNETVWFNQAHIFDLNPQLLGLWRYLGAKILYSRPNTRLHDVAFADGTPIPRDMLYHINEKLKENSIYFPWQKGDLLVLDNILAMHGRSSFSGKRRILTAMTG